MSSASRLPSRPSPRCLSLMLGLVLPLISPGAASAEPGGWVDPPAKPAAAAPQSAKPAASPAAHSPPAHEVAAPAPKAAAETKAHSVRAGHEPAAEAARRRSRPARRLADTPAAGPTDGARAEAARALAAAYLAAVSGPGEAMAGAAPRFYGAQVRFYGRPTTLAALIAEKRGFARRWPERRYEARGFRTACAPGGETCTVRAVVDFRAASPERGAVSRGASELVLEVSFAGPRPVIVAETGRVLRRGAQAGALAPAGGRA